MCPAYILIDDIARNTTLTVSFGYFIRELLGSQQAAALCKAQRPLRRHDGLSGQCDILFHDFLIILTEDKIVNHLPTRSFKAVIITAFSAEFEFCLIRVIQKYTIAITTHKERDTLVQGIFHNAVTRFITLIRFATTVQLAGLFTQTEEMLISAQSFILHFTLSIADMPLVGIVAEEELLILVEYLQTERSLVDADTQFRCKYLITGILFVHPNSAYIFQFFINHRKRRISPLQLTVRRKPDTHNGGTAKLQLHSRIIV